MANADGEPVTLSVATDPEGLGDRVARNVGPDCVGLKDPDFVAVGQGDTEPRLTVKAAEGVATLAEPVGETGGDAVVVIELYEAVCCGDPVTGEALGDTVKKLADTDTVCDP